LSILFVHVMFASERLRSDSLKRVVVIGIIAALIFTGCASTNPPVAGEPQSQGPGKPVYYLSGKIQAASAADLSAAFAGRIEALPVEVGSTVKAGDPLVIFDASEASALAQVSEAAYGIAQANLEKAQTGARPEQIHQAEAGLDSAKIAWENAKKTLERQETLFQSGAVSAAQLETVKGQASAAQALYTSAQEQLAMLKNGETKTYMAVLEKQVQQAKSAWEASQTTLDNRTLKAPFDGVVTACPAKAGETYSAQTVLISLENRDRLTVDAYGPANAAALFKAGQKIKVRVAEIQDKDFAGTVTWVADTIDPKRRAVLVKVSLEPAEELMAGMFTEIGLER